MRKKRSATMFGRSDDPGRSHEAKQAEKQSVDRFGAARSVLAQMNPGRMPGVEGELDGPTIRVLGPDAPAGYRRRRRPSRPAPPANGSGRSRSSPRPDRRRDEGRTGRAAASGRSAPPPRQPPPELVVTIGRPAVRGKLDLDERALADVGEQLRAARERSGLDVDEVSAASGLSPQQIEQFEAGRTPALAPVYVVGQLRMLARLYGLDDDVVVVPPPEPPEPSEPLEPVDRVRSESVHHGRRRARARHPSRGRPAPVEEALCACHWLGCRVLQSVHAHQGGHRSADSVVVPAADPPG